MKILFWILLLANVILFAVMQRGGWDDAAIKAQPALHAEMIRLLPGSQTMPETLSAPVSAVAAASIPAASAATPSASNLHLSMDMVPATGVPLCVEWGDFSGADLARAAAALSSLQLGGKLSQRQVEREIGYWVYIPPVRNKAVVNRKIAELKALGVREYFVMQTAGHWMNAISLGVFKTRDAAQNFLHDLQAKGVRSARVGERASRLKATVFMLHGVDAATENKLQALQKDFAGSEVNNVPCALTR